MIAALFIGDDPPMVPAAMWINIAAHFNLDKLIGVTSPDYLAARRLPSGGDVVNVNTYEDGIEQVNGLRRVFLMPPATIKRLDRLPQALDRYGHPDAALYLVGDNSLGFPVRAAFSEADDFVFIPSPIKGTLYSTTALTIALTDRSRKYA